MIFHYSFLIKLIIANVNKALTLVLVYFNPLIIFSFKNIRNEIKYLISLGYSY